MTIDIQPPDNQPGGFRRAVEIVPCFTSSKIDASDADLHAPVLWSSRPDYANTDAHGYLLDDNRQRIPVTANASG